MTVTKQITDGKTQGVAPKAVLAFCFPLVAAVATSAASWIVSGDLGENELRAAVGGFVLSSVAALGAALGKTGTVQK